MGVGVFLQADLLTVSYSTSRFTGDSQEICLQKWGYFCQQINWLSVNQPGDLEETVKKSAGRNGRRGISASIFADSQLICQQIRRQLGNLLAEMRGRCISAGRVTVFQLTCQQIWRRQSGNPADRNGGRGISASRFTYYQLISQHIWRRQTGNLLAQMVGWVFLPADLLTVSYSASRFGGDSQEICLQKLGGISASRFTDCQLICQQ